MHACSVCRACRRCADWKAVWAERLGHFRAHAISAGRRDGAKLIAYSRCSANPLGRRSLLFWQRSNGCFPFGRSSDPSLGRAAVAASLPAGCALRPVALHRVACIGSRSHAAQMLSGGCGPDVCSGERGGHVLMSLLGVGLLLCSGSLCLPQDDSLKERCHTLLQCSAVLMGGQRTYGQSVHCQR